MYKHTPRTRARRLVVYGALAIVALLSSLATAAWMIICRFDAIERQQTAALATQALRALETDLNALVVSTHNLSSLPAVQNFARNNDRRSLSTVLPLKTLTAGGIDVVALVSADGDVLHGMHVNGARHEARDRLSSTLIESVRKLAPFVAELRQRPLTQHLIEDRGQLLGFAMTEILDSKGHDLPNGALLFCGRVLEGVEATRVGNANYRPLTLHGTVGGTNLAAENVSHNVRTVTRAQNAQRLTGYVRLVNWQGRPIGVISFDAGSEIGSAGRRTTAWAFGAIATLLLLVAGSLVFLARRIHLHWRQRLSLERRYRKILIGLNEIILIVDPRDGHILESNHAWSRLLGDAPKRHQHATLEEIFIDLSIAELCTMAAVGGSHECQLRASDDRLIDAEINVYPLEGRGQPLICVAARDIARRRHTEQQLRENQTRLAHIAEHDALTGLPNRQYLLARLPQLLSQVDAEQRGLALLLVDIDHFKNINDSNSHGWGDQLLKIIARRLQNHVRAEDIVLRLGGDEFLVIALIPNAANSGKVALGKAEKILAALRTPMVHDTKAVSLTASIGIATFPTDGRDGESLLKHADIALHQAKEHGRDCCRSFSTDMNLRVLERVSLEQALRRAIDTEQIFLEYQPIVDLHTGLLVSFEALARWQHPEIGRISPARFIPVAEETGLLIALGQQIVHTVIMQLREWRDRGLVLAPVAINVSPVQFERTDFVGLVHDTASHYGVDLRLLSFEVTESALLRDSARCIAAIDALRGAGSRVYIDDFGTGFSNLSYLKTLPIDAVKIDQSFVRTIETDANDAAIVASIVSVSRQLRLDTVAEGIETAAQAARVRDLGCMYAQGYFFSKPLPAAYCRALLEQLGTVRRLTDTVIQRAFAKAAGG